MATNVTSHEIRQAIITALLNICITDPTHAARIVTKWAALFDRFREDGDVQMEILWGLQRGFVTRLREGVPVARFVRVLQVFYEGDVVEEEKIIRWFEDERARGSGERWGKEMMMVRESAEKFVTWLKEAEEESDE
jgi:translation initiation factor eIF-2B subunit epsilon